MKYVLNGVGEGVGDLLLRQVPQRTPPTVEVLHVAGAAVVDVWSEHGTAPLGLKHTHTQKPLTSPSTLPFCRFDLRVCDPVLLNVPDAR